MAFLASIKSKKWRTKSHIKPMNGGSTAVVNSCRDWNYIWGLGKLLFWFEGGHLHLRSWTLPAIASAVCIADALHTFVGGLHLISCTDDGDKHAQEKFLRADLVLKNLWNISSGKKPPCEGVGKPRRLIHPICKTLITQAKQELWMLNRAALHYIKTKKNHKTLQKGQMSCFESSKAIST